MSLLTALSSGTTGLQASALELSVVGDNIANAGTIGFKGARATFEDALTQSVIGGTGEIGLGARLQSVQKILTQGALTSTGIATDLALQGNGFFIVNGNHNGQTANFYTRAGQFTVDRDGYMVNIEGLRVQGFPADAAGVISGLPGDLLIGTASATPRATTSATIKANLQADAPILGMGIPSDGLFHASDPGLTSNFSTSLTLYDAMGAAHQTQVFFHKNATNTWDWHAMTDGGGLTSGTPGVLQEIASGTLTFDGQGRLTGSTMDTGAGAPVFDPIAPGGTQALTFNFGDPVPGGGTGLAGITQFASPSASTFIGQDGFGSGQLASIRIDTLGNINGIFTNGQSRTLGQVAVAGFSAPDRLESIGGNLYAQSQASGQPVIGAPGAGGRASVISGSLEQSNVDLAEQFVRLISAQRTFEANSKSITTADQLLDQLINLKR